MKIKVCGMTQMEQLHQLDEMGVDFAGLIFYPGSPRYVKKGALQASSIRNAKLRPSKVGVFVNASYDEVMQEVEDYGLDLVQLHGQESPEDCARIGGQIQVIKAFRFADREEVAPALNSFAATDLFLFDTASPGANGETQYGGTGKKFDWQQLNGMQIGKPFFLSGGIAPDDAERIKAFVKDPAAKDLYAVDINSRFELLPGVKDMAAVEAFVRKLKDIN